MLALVHLHGWDYFKALAQNKPMLVQSAVDPAGVVASGERPVAVNGGDYTFYQVKKKGNPVEIVYPKEGVPLVVSPSAITSFAPHPNAARLFTDFIFTREIQQVLADSEGLYTGHPDVKYPADKPKLADLKLLRWIPRSWRSGTRRSRSASWSSSAPERARHGRGVGGIAQAGPLSRGSIAPPRSGSSRRRALVLLILLPLGWLAYISVSGPRGGFTLAHYARVLADPPLQKALWNTVVLAFWVGLVALAIGAPLAWLTARTDLPGRRLIQSLIMASFVTPPFLGAFAWVMLAGPNAGYLNQLYRGLTGAEAPLLNIFTMPGLIFVVTIYTFPYVYIMIANTLGLIASDLEEAAAILGAGRLQVALTITLPMVLPAILSGFILAVLQALALFGSPAILALPAGFHTVTTQIWSLFQYPPKVEMAAAFSIPLLLATALLLLAQKRLLGRRGYAAVGGKGGQRRVDPARAAGATPRSRPAWPSWPARCSCPTASSPRPRSRAPGPSR